MEHLTSQQYGDIWDRAAACYEACAGINPEALPTLMRAAKAWAADDFNNPLLRHALEDAIEAAEATDEQ